MPNLTNNFGYNKPLVNNAIDADLWGGQLNSNWDDIDTDIAMTTASKSSSFAVAASEYNYTYLIDASGGAVTATLPAAANVFNGFTVRFTVIDATNTITIDGNGSETIDGSATLTLSGETLEVTCDGSNWHSIISQIKDNSVTTAKMNNVAYNKNFLHLQDQKTSGTNGGTSSAGDQTRDINTVVTNTITGASLATNQITLPAGTYYIVASAPAYRTARNRIKLYNSTDSADELSGQNAYSSTANDYAQTHAFLSGVFTIATEKDFEIQHYCQSAQTPDGLGIAVSDGTEIYTDVKIWKVS